MPAAFSKSVSTGVMPPDLIFCKIEEWDHITAHVKYGQGYPEIAPWNALPFFKGQKKIVLRNCGLINPSDIEEYIAVGGYQALYKVLIDGRKDAVIEQIKAARLRGRGGAGFLTGNKWDFLAKAKSDVKYIICNADEGDPGAYMNRNEIEGDPHSLLEGMIIGAYVMGATEGIIYVRAEYPLAVRRLTRAIEQAREYGLLGNNILDRGFNFNIELVQGAGAFVCGEETALIASLEGFAGRPHPRPPFPAQKGLWGKPTNINNVETWCNIAPIVSRGAAWFAETGSAKSPGTKVFSLVGKIQNTGLVEMPLGTPLKSFIYDIGEGAVAGRRVKAVQTGGPSGGCIPVEMLDTPVDYESPRANRLHHGLRRHGRARRRQLHGRRRPLLRRIHAFGILRQVRPLPRRPQQGAAAFSTPSPTATAPPSTCPFSTNWAAWSASVRSAASANPRPTLCSPPFATSAKSTKTTSSRIAAAPASARNSLSRPAKTVARCA